MNSANRLSLTCYILLKYIVNDWIHVVANVLEQNWITEGY